MPVDRFRFVSPGVFINEIDQSQLPAVGGRGTGPVIFGVAQKGPALVPVAVSSYSEFVQMFGEPSPGSDANGDPWRDGNLVNPTYGAYAAQAYLANGAPLTFVRLVGDQDPLASVDGAAGWDIPKLTATSTGGAYGLFIIGSGSNASNVLAAAAKPAQGMLAAVFYTTGSGASITLSGTVAGTTTSIGAAGALVEPVSVGSGKEYKVQITGPNEGTASVTFNFDHRSPRFIRKVFNTNPQLTNARTVKAGNLKDYWLGESFGKQVVNNIVKFGTDAVVGGGSISRSNLSGTLGLVLGLVSASAHGGSFRSGYATPATPWIISQDLGAPASFDINAGIPKLFRVHSRNGVEYAQNNYKISFSDIKFSPNPLFQKFGTFTLIVRGLQDTDENPVVYEQYNNLDLNPASNNYIAKRIGDRSFTYDTVNKKWTETGQYDLKSSLIRVQMDESVENGTQDPSLLPFGFRGLPTHRGVQAQSGSISSVLLNYNALNSGSGPVDLVGGSTRVASIFAQGGSGSLPQGTLVRSSGPTLAARAGGVEQTQAVFFGGGIAGTLPCHTASLAMPTLSLRAASSDGRLSKETNAFFGLSTNVAAGTLVFDGVTRDIVRAKPQGLSSGDLILGPGFSLDDLVVSSGSATHSGSAIDEYFTSILGNSNAIDATSPYRGSPGGGRIGGAAANSASADAIINFGFDRFTVPLYGGFDGVDIFERNPFNNTRALAGTSKTTALAPMYYTLKKAIDSVADVDQVDINMAAMPGITDTQTTDYLLSMAEDRKDTLAIIDLEGGYEASTESTESFAERKGDSATTVSGVEDRNFNNSYGAAYYPWVQINSAGRRVWVPPSTVAVGVLAASAARTELWFAPAGFNRGGLNNGNAGLSVVNVIEKLTSTQRDNLYEVGVNPIASFPAEGIVVFGQKTLQATPSALDRINVRRLMIFLKKQITHISNGVLFDPNIQITWNRFLNEVEPFLDSVKNRFGLADYRVILDNTTTTPDLVDRNIMYAKIMLKPTRAIEFIALDFIITRSGVEF